MPHRPARHTDSAAEPASPADDELQQLLELGDTAGTRPAGAQALTHLEALAAIDRALAEPAASDTAIAERRHYMARLSHDLKTPLNAVLGYARLLVRADDPPLSARQRQQASDIHAAGQQMLTLINDILDMDRLASGALRLQVHDIALQPLVASVHRLLAPAAEAAGVRLRLEPPATGWPQVVADTDRLRQVLTNVVSNAINYNRRGGQVTVRSTSRGSRVVLSVEDNGLGMSPEQLQHLYEPYNRLGRENSGKPGSGLGLTMAREMLSSMHGTIQISSMAAVGTLVRIELAACDGALVNPGNGVM